VVVVRPAVDEDRRYFPVVRRADRLSGLHPGSPEHLFLRPCSKRRASPSTRPPVGRGAIVRPLIRLLPLTLLLVACAPLPPIGDARPRPRDPTPPARERLPQLETAPARVRRNGPDVAVVALPAAPGRLDAPPAIRAPLTDQEVAEQMVAHLLHARLVGIDDRGEPYPDLVERVPTLENGGARWIGEGDARQLEVTFRLRANAGLTAAEVVASWRRALDARPPEIATERLYERVEARDAATLVFTFFSERSARAAAAREPNRYGFLRGQSGPVADRLYYLGLPNTWVGAGPYRLRDPAAPPSARP